MNTRVDTAENSNLTTKNTWEDADKLVKARVARSEIQLLAKFVEGAGHLGVVTTTDRMLGEVVIQTTQSCWPELEEILRKLPLEIAFLEE